MSDLIDHNLYTEAAALVVYEAVFPWFQRAYEAARPKPGATRDALVDSIQTSAELIARAHAEWKERLGLPELTDKEAFYAAALAAGFTQQQLLALDDINKVLDGVKGWAVLELCRIEAAVPAADRSEADQANPIPASPNMERLALAIGDDYSAQIIAIANRENLTGEKKMEEIMSLDRRYASKNSIEWGTLLGVSPAAVRGYTSWKILQKASKSGD